MEIKPVQSREQWNSWLRNNAEPAVFAQSWEWGEVLSAEGKKVERLAVLDGGEVVAEAQVVHMNLPFGWKYVFCPRGPTAKLTINKEQLTSVWECLKEYFDKNKIIFFRIEPAQLLIANCSLLIKKTIDINPRATTILDLTKSEEEILSAMHEKTRYNIRLAERKGLQVIGLPAQGGSASGGKDCKILMKLMEMTGKRDGFRLHSERHYEEILDSAISYQLTVFVAEEINNEQLTINKPIATSVFVGFGNTFTYLYGASDHKERSLMAPHLIQWEGIKLAKKLGYKYYDFFGIAPPKAETQNSKLVFPDQREATRNASNYKYDPKHQYAGVTRFKMGFGGETREAPGTFDLIISAGKYKIYKALRLVRRLF